MKRKKVIAILLAAALSAGNLSGLGMLSVAAENTQTEQAMEKENEQTNIALNRTARASNSLGASAEHPARSEEHTSELQSHHNLVCRLLLEKKETEH